MNFQKPYVTDFTVSKDNRGTISKIFGSNLSSPISSFSNYKISDSYLSKSELNVFRGLHMQTKPFSQVKTFQVVQGVVLLVAVYAPDGKADPSSLFQVEIDEYTNFGVIVPEEWATGFLTLSTKSSVWVTASGEYSPTYEHVIQAKSLDISLPVDVIISGKDN